MSNDITILVTVYEKDGRELLKTAVKAPMDILTNDLIEYWGEEENQKKLNQLLPLHCKGEIVAVEEIFDSIIIP
jgi:DNA-binding MarR family transcriptional regulator